MESLQKIMSEHDLNFSEFSRAAILKKRVHSNIDIEFLRQVQKIGVNLNQIAKLVNTNHEIKIETLQSLRNIEKTLEVLVDDL